VQQGSSNAIVVTVVPATPAPERTVGDVILGSFAIAAALLLLALVLGVAVAGLRYAWNRWHPPDDDHMPPVSPYLGR
jgi:hypothetical protein